MSAKARTTVRLGDLVVVAFDWAAQCSSDPRVMPILATKAVTYLLQHTRRTSPFRPAPLPQSSGGLRELLAPETADRPFGVSAARNE